ncbi:MAG: GNAT family acetyltransferase [Actinomycetota bacterium]
MALPAIRTFEERDRPFVIDLWRRCDLVRPWNDPDRDIDRKLAVDDGMFFVAEDGRSDAASGDRGHVLGTVMAGYDGHRGWINYLAVEPDAQDAGIGRLLMERAEHALADAGCPKINLQIRTSNVGATAFYERLGYTRDEVISLGKRLVDDTR